MSFMKEFRNFAIRGNVIDLAVGFIVGGAFNKIVTSLVNDVVMPPIGMALGGVSFGQLYINLSQETFASMDEAVRAGAPIIRYGAFIQTVVDFAIIAFVVFCMVKMISKMQELRKKEEAQAAPVAPPEDIILLREIRDSLKK